MAYPFEQAPTVKDFCDKVKANYNCECKHIDGLHGPKGETVVSYLVRQHNSARLISEPLPEDPNERLSLDTIRRLCTQLKLEPPPYEFLPADPSLDE